MQGGIENGELWELLNSWSNELEKDQNNNINQNVFIKY